jgi:hypothetical protein
MADTGSVRHTGAGDSGPVNGPGRTEYGGRAGAPPDVPPQPRFPDLLSVRKDTSVSTLWTPSGEHEPEPAPDAPTVGPPGPEAGAEEALTPEEVEELRQRLTATPVVDIIANHAIGLWQLAVLHLSLERDEPAGLEDAQLAIDAMAALVEGLGERLGEHHVPLRDALAQVRLAFVEVAQRTGARDGTNPPF